MAKELDEFPEGVGRRSTKYPWDQWFNGRVWECEVGTDFTVPVESFRMTVKAAAKSRGGAVKIAKLDDKRVVLQFLKD